MPFVYPFASHLYDLRLFHRPQVVGAGYSRSECNEGSNPLVLPVPRRTPATPAIAENSLHPSKWLASKRLVEIRLLIKTSSRAAPRERQLSSLKSVPCGRAENSTLALPLPFRHHVLLRCYRPPHIARPAQYGIVSAAVRSSVPSIDGQIFIRHSASFLMMLSSAISAANNLLGKLSIHGHLMRADFGVQVRLPLFCKPIRQKHRKFDAHAPARCKEPPVGELMSRRNRIENPRIGPSVHDHSERNASSASDRHFA